MNSDGIRGVLDMSGHRPVPPARGNARRVLIAVVVLCCIAAFALVAGVGGGPSWLPWGERADVAAPAAGSADPAPAASPPAEASAEPVPPKSSGPCARPVAATPKTTITEVKVGARVTRYGAQRDTDPLPMAIAARPTGGSWLAWLGRDGKVHLGALDCADRLTGATTSFAGIDLQDVQADETGGVLLLTRKGACRTGPLCRGASSPCRTMWMVRFDNNGRQVWQRQVTNLTGARGGYTPGAKFVWWYQHHGRLASDGRNYAAYFGTAITVRNGDCVDIHQGDRMQVVGPKGALLSGHGSFDMGCSHSWTTRIVFDPRTKRFVMVCATDNGCRIAQPSPYRTVA
ncbi:MAG TPA: hypothetical protein VFO77_16500, partial [Actinoplanes sp.]|nr:hypothetical protein [Actinoplanes sp.]